MAKYLLCRVLSQKNMQKRRKTSTGLYRSCAALACFSGTFELIVEQVWFGLYWFGLDRQFEQTDKINVFWFAFLEFRLVCLIEFGLV